MNEKVLAEARLKGITKYLVNGVIFAIAIIGIFFLIKYFSMKRYVMYVSDKRVFGYAKTSNSIFARGEDYSIPLNKVSSVTKRVTGKLNKKYYISVGCADARITMGPSKGSELIDLYETIIKQIDLYR